MAKSLSIQRFLTKPGDDPWASVSWSMTAGGVEAPADWSENAVQIAAHKFFRQKGVAQLGGAESSVRHLFDRVARTIRKAGEWQGYFEGEAAQAFEDELKFILVHQWASFNSPVYFNCGLFPEYGILGTAENFVFDRDRGQAVEMTSAYLRPQSSACFIQKVPDDLIGIFDLLKSEAKLFKYGSGTGTNFSTLRARGESLEGGGDSTGLISYLEIFDKAAQAIKSGGTTRRAAKMVVVDADHPEVLDFIAWKVSEERKARVLLAAGYGTGLDGEAFRTVSGQNSNNSVRVTDQFISAVQSGAPWALKARTTGAIVREVPAVEIWKAMAKAAWECADPGVQYHDTIQAWHMCPASGPIRASNPCSEYMFLDDSACNLASLNLAKFRKGQNLDWEAFSHVARTMLIAQEILVDYSSYPTPAIAENSHRFRPLGLGYANLGGLLMRMGIPYDSDQGRSLARQITAALHFVALDQSSQMAKALGPFDGFTKNQDAVLKVVEKHRRAWLDSGEKNASLERLSKSLLDSISKYGLRNAQVSLIAPTGTIGLLMDCDTLGIEPDFSLKKVKHLAGGGQMSLNNQAVREGLFSLGYSAADTEAIEKHVAQFGTPLGSRNFMDAHAAVFDCALPPKNHPERRVSPDGHLKMMATAQPFLSGAISKTVNLPHGTTPEEIESLFLKAWQLGLKSLAIYRDGSKTLQPLCAEC